MPKTSLSLRERFEAKFTPEPNTGCWIWTASINASGYGQLNANGRSTLAHRFSYEAHRGEIPSGILVCHRYGISYFTVRDIQEGKIWRTQESSIRAAGKLAA